MLLIKEQFFFPSRNMLNFKRSDPNYTVSICIYIFMQFSHGATDLELTTKRDQYPLFFRTVPTEFVFNEPRLQFVNKFGWKDEIGLIYDASPYYSLVSLQSCEFLSMFVLSFLQWMKLAHSRS